MNINRITARCLAAVTLLLGGLTGGGCATDAQVIAQAASVHGTIRPAVITEPTLQQYVQNVGDRIVNAARELAREGYGGINPADSEWMFQDIQFHLVNSETLNAFTTGGQHVYLYSELFRQTETEDAFAAVVAHEFGHVFGRHVQSRMNQQLVTMAAAAAVGAGTYALTDGDSRTQTALGAAGVTAAVGQFAGLGFSRNDEYEADRLGFDFHVRAGYDPERFADFFRTLIASGEDRGPEIVSSHPALANRVQRVEGYVAALSADHTQYRREPIAGGARYRRLQQQSLEIARTTPTDRTLARAQQLLAAFPSCVRPEDPPETIRARELLEANAQQQQVRRVRP